MAVLTGDAATALPIAELAPERAAHVSTRRNFSHVQVHDHVQSYRTGREEGYDVGYAAGVQAAEADIARTVSSLQAAIIQLGTNEADLADQLAELATSLAVELATTILDSELKEPADFATYAIRKALSIALPSEPVTITMHPDDAAHVPGVANVEVKENPMFSRGFAEAVVGTSLVKIDPHSLINQVREVLHIEETPAAPAPAPAATAETAEAPAETAAPKTTARKTKSASTTSTTRNRKTAAAKTETLTTAKRRTSTSTAAKKPARATKKATNAA
ncbi:MAG: FliH/SctL family protein [Ilumatobacteraceae bacterium]